MAALGTGARHFVPDRRGWSRLEATVADFLNFAQC